MNTLQDEEIKSLFLKVKEATLSNASTKQYGEELCRLTKIIGDKLSLKFEQMGDDDDESMHDMVIEIMECMYSLHVNFSLTMT